MPEDAPAGIEATEDDHVAVLDRAHRRVVGGAAAVIRHGHRLQILVRPQLGLQMVLDQRIHTGDAQSSLPVASRLVVGRRCGGLSRKVRAGGATQDERVNTRWRSRSNFARPYMQRLITFRRFTWPSTWPLLKGKARAAITAALSRSNPATKL